MDRHPESVLSPVAEAISVACQRTPVFVRGIGSFFDSNKTESEDIDIAIIVPRKDLNRAIGCIKARFPFATVEQANQYSPNEGNGLHLIVIPSPPRGRQERAFYRTAVPGGNLLRPDNGFLHQ